MSKPLIYWNVEVTAPGIQVTSNHNDLADKFVRDDFNDPTMEWNFVAVAGKCRDQEAAYSDTDPEPEYHLLETTPDGDDGEKTWTYNVILTYCILASSRGSAKEKALELAKERNGERPEDEETTVTFTGPERDIVIAALRLWQRGNTGLGSPAIPEALFDIAMNGRETFLDDAEIDVLIENKINT